MEIKKNPVRSKNDIPEGTITPKVASLVLSGLTESVATSSDAMLIHIDGYGSLVLSPIKMARSTRYNLKDVLAARDCCVIVNNVGHNTSYMRLNENDTFTDIVMSVRPEGKALAGLRKMVAEHLSRMGLELSIRGGGFGLVAIEE